MRAQTLMNQFKKDNDNILITNSDKSNKTVIMNKTEYIRKMNYLLSDTSTYNVILIDPTKKVNLKNTKLVTSLYSNKYIDDKLRFQLINRNPVTPRIYGLPKLHKDGIPLRPIVSTIGSSSYKLAKYLISSLRPLYNNNQYNVKNSFDFKELMDSIILKPTDVLCSFDVIALFTNIPIKLAIQECNERWSEIENHTNLPKQTFLELLTFCVEENNFFKFNNLCYRQTKGLAMGNPLSPVLADIVMTKLFNQCLANFNNKITFIKKYVDDIIIAASPETIQQIFIEFEKFNTNIKFTVEKENNNEIAFLDLKLKRKDNKIITDWYSKPTSSNRLLNYLSSHPKRIKINIAKSFINKVFKLSNAEFHNKNKQIITHILLKNNYPIYLINSLIFNYHSVQSSTISNSNQPSSTSQPTQNTYKSITFNQKSSNNIINIIKKNLKSVKIAEKVPNKMENSYSKLKDKINKEQQENIIYSIPCANCDQVYIGESGRHFEKRMTEHKYDMKNVQKNPEKSALVQHYYSTGHTFNIEEATIIDRESHFNRRKLLEACHIWKHSNKAVNFRVDVKKLSKSYKTIINTVNQQ